MSMTDNTLVGATPFCDPGCNGTLTVSNILLNTYAWDATLLTDLWFLFERRGESTIIPNRQGRRPNPEYFDETEHLIPFMVTGACAADGTPYSDWWAGLRANLAYLHTNVFVPVSTGAGTRPATLTLPGGAPNRTANIHIGVEKARPANDAWLAQLMLAIRIPAGMFT